ncbi:MAG: hypothetical protein WBW41_03515 [Verrucomicrobiia bacterium]
MPEPGLQRKDLGENARPRYLRIDGFSDRADSQPVVPDFSLTSETDDFHLCYLLGLLNSKLLNYFALKSSVILCKKGTQPQIRKAGLERLPIAIVPASQQRRITARVEEVLTIKKRNCNANTRELEREIDQQVYALYNLTPEEKKIVEDAAK